MAKNIGSYPLDPIGNGSTAYGVEIDGALYPLEGEPPTGTPVLGPITKVSK